MENEKEKKLNEVMQEVESILPLSYIFSIYGIATIIQTITILII